MASLDGKMSEREECGHGGFCSGRNPGSCVDDGCGGRRECANATVMMVENAERFGLAQLHQLRGRVGRGEYQSYCIFMQGNGAKETSKRLEILNKSNDGFYIAGEDLKLRGPGDLFGIRQSGLLEFKLGDIYQDADILKAASETAADILSLDEDLSLPQNQELQKKLSEYMKEDLQNLGL